jgi:hypothetical protein
LNRPFSSPRPLTANITAAVAGGCNSMFGQSCKGEPDGSTQKTVAQTELTPCFMGWCSAWHRTPASLGNSLFNWRLCCMCASVAAPHAYQPHCLHRPLPHASPSTAVCVAVSKEQDSLLCTAFGLTGESCDMVMDVKQFSVRRSQTHSMLSSNCIQPSSAASSLHLGAGRVQAGMPQVLLV